MKKANITIRQIVQVLELDKVAPIFYLDESEKKSIHFRYLGKEELDALEDGTYSAQKKYDTSDVGVYLVDSDVQYLYTLEETRNATNTMQMTMQICNMYPVGYDNPELAFCIFCILHEVGHYVYFKDSGMTGLEYEEAEMKEKELIERKVEQLDNSNLPLKIKRLMMLQYNKEYREVKSEKMADDYAKSKFEEAFVKVLQD